MHIYIFQNKNDMNIYISYMNIINCLDIEFYTLSIKIFKNFRFPV